MLILKDHWERLLDRDTVGALEALLPSAISSARWYGGKARAIAAVHIKEAIPLLTDADPMVMVFIGVSYEDSGHDLYTMVLTASAGERALRIQQGHPEAVLAEVTIAGSNNVDRAGLLHDALWDHDSARALLQAVWKGERFQGEEGTLHAASTQAFSQAIVEAASAESSVMQGEQSNTSVRFGRHAMLKLYRRFEAGINPDLEISRVLTARGYPHSPAVLGSLEYVRPGQQPGTVAIVYRFVENQGDAWRYTLSELETELVDSHGSAIGINSPYADAAALLGRRTAELHLALAQDTDDPAFAPEPCGPGYWQSLRGRMTRSVEDSLALLGRHFQNLDGPSRRLATLVLESKAVLLSRLEAPGKRNLQAVRIRCHGDFHLGQVLYTGRDFVIIDFEGEPARPLAERRAKHVPIIDVAGMIRSFHYAACAALDRVGSRSGGDERRGRSELEQQTTRWYRSTTDAFLSGYTETTGKVPFLPEQSDDRDMLLDAYLIEKACYELSYELNNRPSWAGIPLNGLLQLTQST
ncbi:MAG: Trehalose synthase [Nitrospira sp.]|jgi:trehalose synthase-fused probable maltokinase|nr:MAG: Trehalose synthase [Nitrospira sp.]